MRNCDTVKGNGHQEEGEEKRSTWLRFQLKAMSGSGTRGVPNKTDDNASSDQLGARDPAHQRKRQAIEQSGEAVRVDALGRVEFPCPRPWWKRKAEEIVR
jgi:hypothetical protein